jgi:MFS transporter, DHA2 family, multidrug resistance protein
LPLVWHLIHRFEMRTVMTFGFALCAVGVALLLDGTALFAADQFRLALVVFSIGQLLFLVPAMVVGTSVLKPADLPTASLAFNATTLGGATLGVGLVSHFVTEREKFHSNVITENVSLYHTLDVDRLTAVAGALANRLVDDNDATVRAVAFLASNARREAWVLAFNDAFLLVVGMLLIGAVGIFAIGHSPPLRPLNVGGGARP